MVNVLLIGNGAREQALAEAIVRSPQMPKLFSFISSKNPGIADISEKYKLANLFDFDSLAEFVDEVRPDFAVIGPEGPLGQGVVDFLADDLGVPSVGPSKELSRLETSKQFTREIMLKHKLPGCPAFKVFTSADGIKEFIASLPGFVIKPDGLTGGKGVMVQGDHLNTAEEAVEYCQEVLKTHDSVVVEEKLIGEEFSLQSLTDGEHVVDCPPAQDHKRAYANDKGPNTGGMGSYSCEDHLLPFLEKKDVDAAHKITVRMAEALFKETGKLYKGVMYGGFILTKTGVKLIEYNARFGDPEAMNVLPLLRSDFVEICQAIINGNLDDVEVEFDKKATVCKYVVPEGYPENPVKGEKIELEDVEDAEIYYAAVDQKEDGLYMSSSRAIAFVGIADSIEEAEKIAQKAVEGVKGKVFFRKDIGTKELLDKRANHLKRMIG